MKKGFTLIELLVVIAIIAVLSTIVIVALNPAKRFQDSRNSRRWSDVNDYLTAIHECSVDNDGLLDSCLLDKDDGSLLAGSVYEIVTEAGAPGGVCSVTAGCGQICATIDDELAAYLKTLPEDPGGVTAEHTEYSVEVDANGIVTIVACSAEDGATIQISR